MSDRVRVVTWNVWFGAHMFEERGEALLAELARRQPDVIALQEVTPELRERIDATPWTRGYQLHDDDDGSERLGYGVLLLSRVPVVRREVLAMPSRMGRTLVVAELAGGLTVATIHLESTAFGGPDRVAQLGILQPWLTRLSPDVCLVGDMNFTPDDAGETASIDPDFVDVWPALRPTEPGYTVDTDVNTMRFEVSEKRTQKRIDRVFLRSARWRATAIERTGMEPIGIDGTFVSDHFGLDVELVAS